MERDEILSILSDILSRIIHDYNNIMGVIDGYSTLLASEVNDTGAIEDIKEISNVVLKAGKIRERLALFYRKRVSAKEYLDINNIIRLKAEHYLNKSNIELSLSENIPQFNAKKDEMEIMVDEFFKNSILHSGKEKPDILIKTYMIGNDLLFEFSDNGNGIDEKNIDKVFFPFFTTVQNNTRDGLGLSWIWGISRRHSAKVKVESINGRYSKFVVRFININLGTEA
ncbi:MAG: ATP-binding protein [Elusimicrobiales bacterium]|nr:ATP-binding protein [Elusimicrobiales bacterium]